MESIKKMTIAEAKERITNEFCSLMTKDDVLRLLDSINDDDLERQNLELKIENKQPTKPELPEIAQINDGCIHFDVNDNESIHNKIQEIGNLNYPCRFICKDSLNPAVIVYSARINAGWRTTGNGGAQNLMNYFLNTDAAYAEANHYNSIIRWEIIMAEMQRNNIARLTVTVCPQ